jgi:hypothetical protein
MLKKTVQQGLSDLSFLRDGWDDPHCARHSHPPTHWQIVLTHPALRLLRNRFPVACQLPWQGPSNFLCLSWRERPRLSFTARIGQYTCSLQACSFSLQGWGLIDLPLRASNEGLLRPRVARAQKIIRLHPLLCSASKKDTWPLPPHPSEAARCASTGIVPATSPSFSASC